jgi:magnesium chelatase subunit H
MLLTLVQHVYLTDAFVIRPEVRSPQKGVSRLVQESRLWASTLPSTQTKKKDVSHDERQELNNDGERKPHIVLVAGFESFNRDLYIQAASELPIQLTVFADSDIRVGPAVSEEDTGINPVFAEAVKNADAFIGSLVFDYDDVLAVKKLLQHVKGPRLIFESATELMEYNSVGSFNMKSAGDGPAGPPPAVKAVISKFSSGKEEDKISGYLKMLKVGPELLKFIPGEKAGDLRTWLEAYRYWNQGGKNNVRAMMQIVAQRCLQDKSHTEQTLVLPELEVTPDIGLLHPLKAGPERFFPSPAAYLSWRLSPSTMDQAKEQNLKLAPSDAPRVAILLYRKHGRYMALSRRIASFQQV